MDSPAKIALPSNSDHLIISELELVLNVDDEQQARNKAEILFAEVKGVFFARYVALALVYDISFEITSAHTGSWKFICHVHLKLKENWKALGEKTPKVFLAITTLLAGVAGYPGVREGAIQIGKDLRSAYELVIDHKKDTEPGLIRHFEWRSPPSDDQRSDEQLSSVSTPKKLSGNIMSENELLQAPFEHLRRYKTLYKRVEQNKALKMELAKFFWSHCFPGIARTKVSIENLFFESGSTMVYVASEFYHQTKSKFSWRNDLLSKLGITTNNLLVFVQLLFTPLASVLELKPKGIPDERYGATYGRLDELLDYNPPFDQALGEDAKRNVKDLAAEFMSPSFDKVNGDSRKAKVLILASTSGMNLKEPVGPHVGSYRNMLFKRALLMTRAPIVFFVDESKFNPAAYDPNRCFLIFGEDFTWNDTVTTQPIAFCVGSSSEESARKIVYQLMEIGLTMSSGPKPGSEYGDCLPFVVANDAFSAMFPDIRLAPTKHRWPSGD